jgi:hypothetical protein
VVAETMPERSFCNETQIVELVKGGRSRADIAYSLVLGWAYTDIAIEHASTPVVATSAWIGAGLILLILVVAVISKDRRQEALINA